MIFGEFNYKKVIDLASARELGTVEGIYIDKTNYIFLGFAVSGCKDKILNGAGIIGKDNYITVCQDNAFMPAENCIKICIGQKVLTRTGRELGTVTDIVFGRKYIKIMIGEESIAPYKITAASDSYLVVNLRIAKPVTVEEDTVEERISPDENVYDNISTPEETNSEPQNNLFVTLEPFGNPENGNSFPKAQFEEFIITATAPLRYSSVSPSSAPDYSFLLGRKVEREISDLSRTFHIAVGTIITEQVLNYARKAGKVVDLAINSSKV